MPKNDKNDKSEKTEDVAVPAEPGTTPNESEGPNSEPDTTDENRVVNNGDVSDPGNSGGFESSGEVSGSADKPKG